MPNGMAPHDITSTGSTPHILRFLNPNEAALFSLISNTHRQQKLQTLSLKTLGLRDDTKLPLPLQQVEEFLFYFKQTLKTSTHIIAGPQPEHLHPLVGLPLLTLALNNQTLFDLLKTRELNTTLKNACIQFPRLANIVMHNPELRKKLPENETTTHFSARLKRAWERGIYDSTIRQPFHSTLTRIACAAFYNVTNTILNDYIRPATFIICKLFDTFIINPIKYACYAIAGFFKGLYTGWTTPNIAEIAAHIRDNRFADNHVVALQRITPTQPKPPGYTPRSLTHIPISPAQFKPEIEIKTPEPQRPTPH